MTKTEASNYAIWLIQKFFKAKMMQKCTKIIYFTAFVNKISKISSLIIEVICLKSNNNLELLALISCMVLISYSQLNITTQEN